MTERRDETIEELFDRGLEVRRAVLGAEYVDNSLKSANDFMMAFQNITTEWCWGYAWTRSGLDRKTRSLLNLAMLTALNRSPEIKLHVRGALNNGVTVEEIKEVLLHATVYCGIPAGLDAFKAKMTPEYWEPVFAISNEPVFSASTLYSIALAFTDNHPFHVIGRGLVKAAAAEFASMKKWAASIFRS